MKIIFAGTPAFAAVALDALIKSKHEVLAVYTQPDKPVGRGQKMLYPPVKQLALENNIPVIQPLSLKNEIENLKQWDADVMVVVAYGMILPEAVLNIPRYGCLNIHASLLPRWRGAAPIQRAILEGDSKTGITIMQMDKGLDTGAMLYQTECEITATDTSEILHDRLAALGAQSISKALEQLSEIKSIPQNDSLATYAKKIYKEEALIDWQSTAEQIERKVRAFIPWPVAFTHAGEQTLRIWEAKVVHVNSHEPPGTVVEIKADQIEVATSKGILAILRLQLPGGKNLSVREILNSPRPWLKIGTKLT